MSKFYNDYCGQKNLSISQCGYCFIVKFFNDKFRPICVMIYCFNLISILNIVIRQLISYSVYLLKSFPSFYLFKEMCLSLASYFEFYKLIGC